MIKTSMYFTVALVLWIAYKRYQISRAGLTVTSGYRTPWHNYKVGGSTFSQHMLGMAWDVTPSNPATRATLDKIGFGTTVDEGDHIHVSII